MDVGEEDAVEEVGLEAELGIDGNTTPMHL